MIMRWLLLIIPLHVFWYGSLIDQHWFDLAISTVVIQALIWREEKVLISLISLAFPLIGLLLEDSENG